MAANAQERYDGNGRTGSANEEGVSKGLGKICRQAGDVAHKVGKDAAGEVDDHACENLNAHPHGDGLSPAFGSGIFA